MQSNETGRSMLEMLAVLAIIGILSAGAIAGYTLIMKSYRVNKALDLFQLASAEIITAFGDNTNFTSLTGNADRLRIDLTSPYGGNIEVQGSVGSFSLTMNNVPEGACIKIAQSGWDNEYTLGTADNVSQFAIDPFTCKEINSLVFTHFPGAI